MSSTQFWVGLLVPSIVKWAGPFLRKFFKLKELDAGTQTRIANKNYPVYYAFLYNLWIIAILTTGVAVLLLLMIYGMDLFPQKNFAVPVFIGLINMIGAWLIFGALLDFLFWQAASDNFRDYVLLRQLQSGWGFDIRQQITTLLKLGLLYYLITTPLMVLILVI